MPLNTSVSCMPQPSTCSCRLPGLKPSTLSAGLQGNNSYSYMPLNTSVSYMPQPSTCSCPPSNPPNASNPPAGLQGNNSYSYMPLPSVFQEVQECRLPALKPPKRFRRPPRQQLLQLYMPLPSVFQGVQDCRLPGVKPPKRFRRPPRQQLLQLHAPAICFSGGSRLPFGRPQTPQTLPTLPQASKATTLTATCPCHLFFRRFKTAVCLPSSNPPNASNPSAGLQAGLQGNNSYSYSYSYMPLPSVFQGVHGLQEPVIHRLLWGFCCGTNHFVFLHGFPAGVSWLTWICPNERHDHTTVRHTGHEWAWRRVFLLTRPSFT